MDVVARVECVHDGKRQHLNERVASALDHDRLVLTQGGGGNHIRVHIGVTACPCVCNERYNSINAVLDVRVNVALPCNGP